MCKPQTDLETEEYHIFTEVREKNVVKPNRVATASQCRHDNTKSRYYSERCVAHKKPCKASEISTSFNIHINLI